MFPFNKPDVVSIIVTHNGEGFTFIFSSTATNYIFLNDCSYKSYEIKFSELHKMETCTKVTVQRTEGRNHMASSTYIFYIVFEVGDVF